MLLVCNKNWAEGVKRVKLGKQRPVAGLLLYPEEETPSTRLSSHLAAQSLLHLPPPS